MRKVLILFLCLGTTIVCGCHSSPSTVRELNENSAKTLVEEYLQHRDHRFSLRGVLPTGRTTKDMSTGDSVTKRMIDANMIVQTAITEQFPKISGSFTALLDYHVPPGSFGGTRWRRQIWTLEPVPDSNHLVGTFSEQTDNMTGPSVNRAEGTVELDGKVDLRSQPMGWNPHRGVYREQSDKGILEFTGEQPSIYVGKPSNQTTPVKWFTYAWAPDFQKQIEGTGENATVVSGKVEITDLTDLRLLMDTEAHANIKWRVDLNSVGKAFMGNKPAIGKGDVTFGKKPDGSWFVDQTSPMGANRQE
jgi:hypothetical protein